MKTSPQRPVKLDIASRYEMLEMVQTVLLRVAETAGFDEETAHYMSVAVRESVVNAIKHGHKGDEAKRVTVTLAVHGDGGGDGPGGEHGDAGRDVGLGGGGEREHPAGYPVGGGATPLTVACCAGGRGRRAPPRR